jgi:hypothetical protein
MTREPIRPTRRDPFVAEPRLIAFVHSLADDLDGDFTVTDYSFDGRDFVIDYEDGSAVILKVRATSALVAPAAADRQGTEQPHRVRQAPEQASQSTPPISEPADGGKR